MPTKQCNGYTPNFHGFKGVLNGFNTLKMEIVTLNGRSYNYIEVNSLASFVMQGLLLN